MLVLSEKGLMPGQIRVVDDWKVQLFGAAVHLGTLCWLAWQVGTTLGKLYP